MLHLLRKHQYGIMLVVAVIVIVAFAFFYDPNYRAQNRMTGKGGTGFNILGERVSTEEIEEIERSFGVLQSLRSGGFTDPAMQHLIGMLSVEPKVQEQEQSRTPRDYVVTTALTRVEARRLGIAASDAEIEERVQQLPAFQTPEGKFDPERWSNYINAIGGESGTQKKLVYKTVGDIIMFEKLVALAGAPLPVSTTKVELNYLSGYQRVTGSVISFAEKDYENQDVTDDELKAYYEKHKDEPELMSEEKRTFHYTLIAKPKDEELKDLDETAKADKLREYKKTAAALADRLVAEDRAGAAFADLATSLKLEAKKAELVTRAAPPEDLKDEPRVLATAFAFHEPGRSEVIEGSKGYYALELAAVEPPATMDFDTAKEKVTKLVKAQKQEEKFKEATKEAAEKVKAALAAGKSIADAAKEIGKEATELPPFGKRKPLTGRTDEQQILSAAITLEAGSLSDVLTTPDGAILVYVAKKELPKDPKMEEQKKSLANMEKSQEESPAGSPAFRAWFSALKRDAISGLAKQ